MSIGAGKSKPSPRHHLGNVYNLAANEITVIEMTVWVMLMQEGVWNNANDKCGNGEHTRAADGGVKMEDARRGPGFRGNLAQRKQSLLAITCPIRTTRTMSMFIFYCQCALDVNVYLRVRGCRCVICMWRSEVNSFCTLYLVLWDGVSLSLA